MKLPAVNLNAGAVLAVAAVGVVAFVAWKAKQAIDQAGGAGVAFNPADPGNLANQAFLALGRAITGNPDFSGGVAVWDFLHPDQVTDNQVTPLPVKPAPAFLPDSLLAANVDAEQNDIGFFMGQISGAPFLTINNPRSKK